MLFGREVRYRSFRLQIPESLVWGVGGFGRRFDTDRFRVLGHLARGYGTVRGGALSSEEH